MWWSLPSVLDFIDFGVSSDEHIAVIEEAHPRSIKGEDGPVDPTRGVWTCTYSRGSVPHRVNA